MLRKFALTAVTLALGVTSAKADFLTELADVRRQQVNAADTTLSNVARLNWQGGASYVNQLNRTGTPQAGDSVIAVSVAPLTNFTTTAGTTPFPGAQPNGLALIAVTQGTITGGGLNATVQFNAGTLFLTQLPNQNVNLFDTGNPATWGNFLAPVAKYSVASPDAVSQGNPNATGASFAASQVNNITLNIGAPQQNQGRLITVENPNNTTATGLNSFINTTTFNGVPGGITALTEGLFHTFNETLSDNTQAAYNLNAADIGILNNIVAAAGLTQTFFATLGTGNPTDYNPSITGTTGDFSAQLSIESSPTISFTPITQTILPEPLTLAVFGAMAAGAFGIKRRRMKAVA